MLCLKTYREKNPFFLAPMAGVTDKPFRSFMREMGCGIMTSELVSARALQDNNHRTRQLMEFSEDQRPYGIQIFGEDPYVIGEGAKKAEEFGADFIDLNLGCPVNKIVKKGAGSALLKDLKALAKVLHSLKSSVQIPVSLKIRTGWDENSRNADKVANIAYNEGFSWMSIHGRTRSQAYSGLADWNYIEEVSSQTPLPVVGNGDLDSGEKAFSALHLSSCSAVMIGRGCLNDPWIFLLARNLFNRMKNQTADEKLSAQKPLVKKLSAHSYNNKLSKDLDKNFTKNSEETSRNSNENSFLKEKACANSSQRDLTDSQQTYFKKDFKIAIDKLKVHLENFYDERMFILQLKKFSSWFSAGFPNSTEFRKSVFQEKDKQVLIQKIDEFFLQNQDYEKPSPKYEPFLMRGHG